MSLHTHGPTELLLRCARRTGGPVVVASPEVGAGLEAILGEARQIYWCAGSAEAAARLRADAAARLPSVERIAWIPATLRVALQLLPINPGVVLVGGGACDGDALSALLDRLPIGAVVAAEVGLDELERRMRLISASADGGILEAADANGLEPLGLPADAFAALRAALDEAPDDLGGLEQLTCDARRLLAEAQARNARWPFRRPGPRRIPRTLPGGTPWPRISIVTASYNHSAFIEETILSILNQGYPNVEHIVIDGGSTDGTVAILERYASRLAYWVSEPDRGQSHAINKGFERATGEIVTWLNSDDLLAPGALFAAALAFVTSGADMVAGIAEVFDGERFVGRHITSCQDGPLDLGGLLDIDGCWLPGQFFHQPEVFFRREVWERAGGRLDERLHFSMDYDLWLRMARAGARLHVVGTPLAWFRRHDEQKTFSPEDYAPELRDVRDRFLAEHPENAPPVSPPAELKRKLRIVLFNDNGFQYGAGIAHRRLAEALRLGGHDLRCFSCKDALHGAETVPVGDLVSIVLKPAPDVVLLGNLHGAPIPPEFMAELSARVPVLFFMHDLWLITGRCAYTGGCDKFLTGCDETCPTPDEYPSLAPEKIRAAWEAKTRVLAAPSAPHVLANSRAVADMAATALRGRSGFAGLPAPALEVIRLPLPLDELVPLDKRTCRIQLGLPEDAFIVLFSASSLHDKRKGLDHLARALRIANLPKTLFACLGREEAASKLALETVRFFGYLGSPRELAVLYSAADVFVAPSLEETFGQVFTEAAACGTPAVGYPVGGVPEAIRHGFTGLLAEAVDPASLAAVLTELWASETLRRDIGFFGPIVVRNEHSPEKSLNQLHAAMRRALAERGIALTPKILFAAPREGEPNIERIRHGLVRLGAGFGRFETSPANRHLGRYAWAFAPKCELDVVTDTPGRFHLVIEYTCPLGGQSVAVKGPRHFLGNFELAASPSHPRVLAIPFFAAVGTQRFTIYPRKRRHHATGGPEGSAFRLHRVTLLPRPAPPHEEPSVERHQAAIR